MSKTYAILNPTSKTMFAGFDSEGKAEWTVHIGEAWTGNSLHAKAQSQLLNDAQKKPVVIYK